MRNIVLASAFALILAALPAHAEGWPTGARLTILGPANGATVSGPVTVVMGLAGLGVAPAGVDRPDTGHHHILVDAPAPEGAVLEESMPADDHVKHFGGGLEHGGGVILRAIARLAHWRTGDGAP